METPQIVLLVGVALLVVLFVVGLGLGILRYFAMWLVGTTEMLVVLNNINAKLEGLNRDAPDGPAYDGDDDFDDDAAEIFEDIEGDSRRALHILKDIDAKLEAMNRRAADKEFEEVDSLEALRDIDAKLGEIVEIVAFEMDALDAVRGIEEKRGAVITESVLKKIDDGDDSQ